MEVGAMWDQMYGVAHYRYGTAPNAFVAEQVPQHLAPGARVLVVGDGEGRNGVWLAEQGHQVTTIEPSIQGVNKARKLAAERGVAPDIRHGLFPQAAKDLEPVDAVVLTFVHVPPPLRPGLHAAVIQALKPGGLVILEGFRPEQRTLGRTSGGPPAVPPLFTEQMLREDFGALEILVLTAPTVELSEGPGHSGPAEVIRLIARRP
ncbi:MAG: class I SAM-dependent methyltransferase [Myxococcota bacterium]|nr:class I SAM-dependent methyltransferase [Myxococcota bacterium]